jgi:hypothetical protein
MQLLCSQIHRRSGTGDLAEAEVDQNISELILLNWRQRRFPDAPQQRAYTRQQLFRVEGFDQVIVRARAQTLDTVVYLRPRREHQDCSVKAELPHAPAQLEACLSRKHDIEDHKIESLIAGHAQSLVTVARYNDIVAMSTKEVRDDHLDVGRIFNHKNPRRHAF